MSMMPAMMTQAQIDALTQKSKSNANFKGKKGGMNMDQMEMMRTAHMKQFQDQMSGMATQYLEVINITEDAGIVKKVVKAGDGPMPNIGQEVRIQFGAQVLGKDTFDSSEMRKGPLTLIVGKGHVIDGLDKALLTMKLSEKSELIIQPKYGYGAVGSPPKVPGNSTIVMIVELVQIGDRRPSKWSMDDAEIQTTALRLKDEGNAKFKEKLLREAENLYRDGIYHMDQVKGTDEAATKLRITLHQNLALVLNQQGHYGQTINFCTKALTYDQNAVKAYYHRSVAYLKTRQYDEAIGDLRAAIKLSPNDKKMRQELEQAKEKKKQANLRAMEGMKGMFSQGIYDEKDDAKGHTKFDKLPQFDPENVQTWMEVAIGDKGEEVVSKGKIYFEVFSKTVPKAAENFRQYCEGTRAWCYSYKDCIFHRIVQDKYVHGGDVDCHSGKGGLSIYGKRYDDENIWLPHTHKGILTNYVTKQNDNSCQFLITLGPCPELNLHNTVFARVIKNMEFVEEFEDVGIGSEDKPMKRIMITGAGVLEGDQKLSKEECDSLWIYDK